MTKNSVRLSLAMMGVSTALAVVYGAVLYGSLKTFLGALDAREAQIAAGPPSSIVQPDGSILFDVVEYRSDAGHVLRCISPGSGKVECY